MVALLFSMIQCASQSPGFLWMIDINHSSSSIRLQSEEVTERWLYTGSYTPQTRHFDRRASRENCPFHFTLKRFVEPPFLILTYNRHRLVVVRTAPTAVPIILLLPRMDVCVCDKPIGKAVSSLVWNLTVEPFRGQSACHNGPFPTDVAISGRNG